ncbi:MAG TPA: hypothetical protein VKS20_12495 [Candidatus Acidoferrales bacterium]|nr:hypothetical protein [Candidatus Acidoferrales bacterium]
MPDWKSDSRPDWHEAASRKLADSKLSSQEREQIARELAGYLEDLCSDAPSRGIENSAAAAQIDATQIAVAELHEDQNLGATLYRARKENPMNVNNRTKRFWLPGTAVLLASALLLEIFQLAGFSPYLPHFWAAKFGANDVWMHHSLAIYVPWLCALPFLGAAGTYWSRRQGSGPALQIAVGLFPAMVFLATFAVFVPLALAVGTLPPVRIFLPALTGQIISWVVIPGAALLLGILPFLRAGDSQRRIA